MPSKLVQCCNFLDSFKQITLNRTALTICMLPFALFIMILVLMFLLTAENPGAVVSNSLVCASVGNEILEEGGSAVDAAIGTMLCEGVALPNSAGIGGGFSAVIFTNGRFDSIVATPTVPLAMENLTNFDESMFADESPKAVGVPGELMGYWQLHQKYGVLSWKRLLQPTIELCEQGVPITEWLAGILRFNREKIVKSKSMGTVFNFFDNEGLGSEQRLQYLPLAQTLKIIAEKGVDAFYKGAVGDSFIEDLRASGGVLTKKDLENYKVIWNSDPPTVHIKSDYRMVTTPLPTSGALNMFIMNVVKNLNYEENVPLFWHRTVEAMKHAFGQSGELGDADNDPEFRDRILKVYNRLIDPDFARSVRDLIKDDKVFQNAEYYGSKNSQMAGEGSVNICVLSPRGDAVASTSSISSEFGSFFASPSTGIIANNLLTRFTNASSNRPLPGKHTFSPYSPTIVLRAKTSSPFFIVGASGGPKATTLVATALIKYVLMGRSADEAVNFQYLHNQLYPNRVEYEEDIENHVLDYLKKVGHEVIQRDMTYENFTAVTCIGLRFYFPDIAFNKRIGGSKAMSQPKSDLNILLVILVGGLAGSVIGLMLYEVLHPTSFNLFLPIKSEEQPTVTEV